MAQTLHRILFHVVPPTKDRTSPLSPPLKEPIRLVSLLKRNKLEYEERFLWH